MRGIKVSTAKNEKGNSVKKSIKIVDQSIDRKNRKKEDTVRYIYSFPRLVIIGLCIISFIYFIGTIVIICLLNNSGLSAEGFNNLINNLAVFDLLSIGIAIIAIAVSVWVGLNVYNFISRDEMKDVTRLIKDQRKDIESQSEEIRQSEKKIKDNDQTVKKLSEKAISLENQLKGVQDLALQEFISAVSRSGEKYIISAYFADYFRKNKLMNINTEMIFQLTTAELLYDDLTEYYEKGRAGDCYETSQKVQEMFEGYKSSIAKLPFDDENTKNMILAYLDSRIADTLFYKNMSKKRDSFKEDMEKSADMFEGILDIVKENHGYKEAKACQAYCYNTIGYTYDQLYMNNKEDSTYLDKAIANSKNALLDESILPPRTIARYNRNLGLTYDHKEDYEKALDHYRKAVKNDIKDYKGWVAIASAIIKIIESNTQISKREKILSSYESSQFKKYLPYLEEAKNAALFCMRLNPGFIDSYNKMITICMFQILSDVGPDNTKKAKETAEEYIGLLDGLGCIANGFLFAKRNYYDTIGNFKKASEINNTIIDNNPKSYERLDCPRIRKLYASVLKPHNP